MTKEEAEKKVSELNEDGLKSFCPMIKNTCRKDCIVYIQARAVQLTEVSWQVYENYCSCNLFMEEIEVNTSL